MKTHAKALLVPDSVPVSSVRRARAATTLRSLVVALAAATLGACSMIPVFERPAAPVPATFPQATPTAAPVVAPLADTIAWRDYFADQRLREVIALALENNRDLRVAALNIERARAQYGIQQADLFPSIAVSGGQSAQRVPGDLSMTGDSNVSRQYSANLGFASYELDFFGRVR